MNDTDLAFTSALEQAQLIRTGEVSPLELTQFYCDRIAQLNPHLGSFFYVAEEQAIAEAQAKTEQLRQTNPQDLPPFFGVPTAIKDLNPVAGMPFTCGNLAMKDNIASYDDGIVQKLKGAGFTILGKTASSEFGAWPYVEPPGFPPSRNPWNLDHTSGGSSGGAASAVAAGLCAVAQGSDGGGSIRTPAACCGIVGLKPSRGRVTHAPAGDYLNGIATDGILTRTVADAAALLDVMSGYVVGDPYWLPAPPQPFLEALNHPPQSLRIAFSTQITPIGPASEPGQQAVRQTVQHLAEMGHHLTEASPDFTGLTEPFIRVWQAGTAFSGLPLEALSPMNQWLVQQAGSAGDYLQAVLQMQVIARQIVAFFESFDLLVLPVHLHAPPRVGEWADLSPEATLEKIIQWIAPCPGVNAAGLPAIALPVLFDPQGLPVGVQLIGKPADDGTILAVAAQLEQRQPWIQNRPVTGS
ncbi:amidase [Spirulina subsalsa]|uniref:amidase n=1 Tax=Spirulina subsalsa TaxID=54311 RepID=UPI0003177F3F|nr:amidase [Spirulina subsalsa]